MKLNTKLVLLILSLGIGAIFSSVPIVIQASPVLSVNLLPPKESVDFSDFDLRDENNNPVNNTVVLSAARRLWISSYHQLLLNNLTPMRRYFEILFNQKWHSVSAWFKNIVGNISQRLMAVLQNKEKRIQSLPGEFGVGSPLVKSIPREFQFSYAHQSVLIKLSSTCLLR